MNFISTRDASVSVSPSKAIIDGISADGGLYVPEYFPKVSEQDIKRLCNMDYAERAAYILSLFLNDFSIEELQVITDKAAKRFEDGEPAPLLKIDNNTFMLELWHGPTHAFKDIALTVMPLLLTAARQKQGISDKILILVATSGDTGKAALEGFKDIDGTKILTLYPEDGVSNVQKRQMTTQQGENVRVFGIKGNFDDAQTAVKRAFNDKELRERVHGSGYIMSSANSINIGRLLPQIAYYFSAYCDLLSANELEEGEKLNFCVPTGNFGNILAGYYAKKMGLKINMLICASNSNNVLTDFFQSGDYNSDRKFNTTVAPSMDILISSNLERLIFEMSGRDAELTKRRMQDLISRSAYSISDKERAEAARDFFAGYCDDDSIMAAIGNLFESEGYLMDTHTAVAASVLNSFYLETSDKCKTVVISTASPYKFIEAVMKALKITPGTDLNKSLKKLYNLTALEIPKSLQSLFSLPVLHSGVIDKDGLTEEVLRFVSEG